MRAESSDSALFLGMADTADEIDPLEASRMSLGSHLDELRRRLMYSVGAIFVCFVGCWIFNEELGQIVLTPGGRAVAWYDEARVELYEEKLAAALAEAAEGEEPGLTREDFFKTSDPNDKRLAKPTEWPPVATGASAGFMFKMKTCFYFSLFISGSFILWQMWLFIAAGLYKHERTAVYAYLPFSVALFLGGVIFGYSMTVPYAYYFVAAMAIETVTLLPRIEEYWTFLTSLSLMMGIVFQLPVLMVGLTRMELIQVKTIAKYRGHFALVALIAAAIITPPDPYTQMMMAIPMVVLYELGIWLSRLFAKRAKTPKIAPVE